MVLSASALLPRPISSTLPGAGRKIIVPTGALIGLDAVSAAAEGTIVTCRWSRASRPEALAGAPYLIANGYPWMD